MKKWVINIAIATSVMIVTALVAHSFGVKSWETCFAAGAGAGVASLLTSKRREKKFNPLNDSD
jgi:hypothetical protein